MNKEAFLSTMSQVWKPNGKIDNIQSRGENQYLKQLPIES